jgi:IS30 family transposase
MSTNNITYTERKAIQFWLHFGKSIPVIAEYIKRHRTSIAREIKRNSTADGFYIAEYAQYLYENRKSQERVKYVTENSQIVDFVKANVSQYSPDVIAGRAKLEGRFSFSTESAYMIVYSEIRKGAIDKNNLYSCREKRKSHRRSYDGRGSMGDQRSIHELPHSAKNRSRQGYFEADTIVGKAHKSMTFTAIDRKNMRCFVHKLSSRDSKGLYNAAKLMKQYYGKSFKALIVDNGKEFALHQKIEKQLGVKVYFAEAGKPYQRGLNEGFNKLLRRYLPKGSDFRKLSWQYVRQIMYFFNNLPRRSLGYRTPHEVATNSKIGAILI